MDDVIIPRFSVVMSTPRRQVIAGKANTVDEEGVVPSKPRKNTAAASQKAKESKSRHQVTIDDYKLLVFDDNGTYRTFSLNQTLPLFNPDPNLEEKASFIGSLDGLVCVVLSREEKWDVELRFFNPFTGAFKKLATFPRYGYGLPPLSEHDPIGFYKDSSGDYKLLCLVDYGCVGAFVYSRRSDSWRQIEFSAILPKERRWYKWSPAIFCGQCLYFEVTCVITDPFPFWPFGGFSRVICFDVDTEKFREIPVPHCLPKPTSDPDANASLASLVVLNECLHMYLSTTSDGKDDVEHRIDLWRLKDECDEYDDEWVKVDDYAFRGQQQPLQHICTVSTGNWLAVFDQDDNSFKKIETQAFKARYHNFTNATNRRYRSTQVIYVQTHVDP